MSSLINLWSKIICTVLMKTLSLLILFFSCKALIAQNHISFRNTLNEANFWFYEANYDSARVYYEKAEKFNLAFYPEEVHLYSRSLWELGNKKRSIKILKKGGFEEFFLGDTTFYLGLNPDNRRKISSKLKSVETDLLCKNIDFYDSLHKQDQKYRKLVNQYPDRSKQSDSIWKLMRYHDSLNFHSLLNEIKINGYPSGYTISPIEPRMVMLHALPNWLINSYHIFQKEIEAGRMSFYDFSQAMDRCFMTKGVDIEIDERSKPYNSYFPLSVDEIYSPSLVFVNRCLIGMSPYYDIYIPSMYKRGTTPPKSKLYEYYKRSKENFNCIRIK